jgi:signal transduction protein with GAF and PtsI domain
MPACSSTCRISSEIGAAGIGLFRTELQFMVARTCPTTAEQQALYDAVLDAPTAAR